MTAQSTNSAEAKAFHAAMRQWLSGDVTGHLGNFMYTDDRDDHRWQEGHSSGRYYLGRDDKATFNITFKDLNVTAQNFLDLGPGGEASVLTKSLPVMRRSNANNYYPVDLSPTLANEALAIINRETGSQGISLISNFFESIPVQTSDALIAIMGGTIGNLETYTKRPALQARLKQIFSLYRQAVGENSYFLISFDSNENGDEIIACYDNPEFGGLVRSCVERAIDVSGFDYRVVWTPDNFQLATGLRATRDQNINFDGAQFAIEKDEFLPVLNSYRFPVAFVKEAAATAGWDYQKTWSASGRVHYMLFRTHPPTS